MTETADIAVLVPGKLHPHALSRIERSFSPFRLETSDARRVTPEMAASVRAVAVMGRVDAAFIDALPGLEIISNMGVGYDAVDADHAASKGIVVTHTPDVLTEEVADVAIGLLINTVRELPKAEAWLRAGRWASQGPFTLSHASLRGRKVGVFGLGRIGKAIARRVEAFGLPVSYHNRNRVADVGYDYFPTLAALAEAVDTLISVAPGNEATHKAVNGDILEKLGPDGVFINVGRGSTVDEDALVAALSNGTIRAAGLDVFASEPHVPDALLALDNACLLPHVASASIRTRDAMADLVVDNLLNWFTRGRALTPVPECAALSERAER